MDDMKLMVLEALQNIPDGLTLEYEAIEKLITIAMEYVERDKFDILNIHMDKLIEKFNNKSYIITYDNTVSKKYCDGILKHYRYVHMRLKKETK